jgi:hypothetical protein
MGRLAIFSEAVTTHASPAGRFGLAARNAPTLTTHRTVAVTAAATTSEDICSPQCASVWSPEGKLFAASVRSEGEIDASVREGDPDQGYGANEAVSAMRPRAATVMVILRIQPSNEATLIETRFRPRPERSR